MQPCRGDRERETGGRCSHTGEMGEAYRCSYIEERGYKICKYRVLGAHLHTDQVRVDVLQVEKKWSFSNPNPCPVANTKNDVYTYLIRSVTSCAIRMPHVDTTHRRVRQRNYVRLVPSRPMCTQLIVSSFRSAHS